MTGRSWVGYVAAALLVGAGVRLTLALATGEHGAHDAADATAGSSDDEIAERVSASRRRVNRDVPAQSDAPAAEDQSAQLSAQRVVSETRGDRGDAAHNLLPATMRGLEDIFSERYEIFREFGRTEEYRKRVDHVRVRSPFALGDSVQAARDGTEPRSDVQARMTATNAALPSELGRGDFSVISWVLGGVLERSAGQQTGATKRGPADEARRLAAQNKCAAPDAQRVPEGYRVLGDTEWEQLMRLTRERALARESHRRRVWSYLDAARSSGMLEQLDSERLALFVVKDARAYVLYEGDFPELDSLLQRWQEARRDLAIEIRTLLKP